MFSKHDMLIFNKVKCILLGKTQQYKWNKNPLLQIQMHQITPLHPNLYGDITKFQVQSELKGQLLLKYPLDDQQALICASKKNYWMTDRNKNV